MLRVLSSEWIKLRRSSIWLLVLICPMLGLLPGAEMNDLLSDPPVDLNQWELALPGYLFYYGSLFLPLLAGVFATFLCRFEHTHGGWKQILSLPVPRSHIYWSKLFFVLLLLAVSQLVMFAGVICLGYIQGITDPIPWDVLLRSLAGGWLATVPLAALQLWASVSWKSFGAPFALNVVLTLPAIMIGQSATFGPFYPWAQPMLAMLPGDSGLNNVSPFTLFVVIIGGAFVAILGGWRHFVKRDVYA